MKCEYCGRKGETCCDPEVLYQKFTGRCAKCGSSIKGGRTVKEVALYFGRHGNWCHNCEREIVNKVRAWLDVNPSIPVTKKLSTPNPSQDTDSSYTEEVPNNKE